jgi:hypothetical protein
MWTREIVAARLRDVRKPMDHLEKMAGQGRKIPSSEVKACLEKMEKPLAELEHFCDPRLKMPLALKKSLATTVERVKATEKRIKSWAITDGEKDQALIRKRRKD